MNPNNDEATRLSDQANTLSELLHHDTLYPSGATVLECGCGTGSQTVILATNSPEARITAVDISQESMAQAKLRIDEAGCQNVSFRQADIFDLPFANDSFDHVFICFVLEHLHDTWQALDALRRVIKPGGTLTAIEGDHGSWYCHPQTAAAVRTVECLIEVQARLGGDPLIGRRLYPQLVEAGFEQVRVSPRMVYVDASKPELAEGFSRNTFIAMVEGVREQALQLGLVDENTWKRGISDMKQATKHGGTFCYTFFKAVGLK